jgi:hypothetical protein
VGLAMWLHWYITAAGLAGEPAPRALWGWIALTGLAGGIVVVGWRGVRRWRRATAVLATLLCLLSSGLVLNAWVGYVPTVYSAWSQLTAGPLPDQTDRATLAAMQSRGEMPAKGVVVPVAISAETSKFRHRGELVYLPPAWFASVPPPKLPVVIMVGAEINTPADWLRVGGQPPRPMHSRPPTAGLRRCWCSSIRAAGSASTPNASTGAAATQPII